MIPFFILIFLHKKHDKRLNVAGVGRPLKKSFFTYIFNNYSINHFYIIHSTIIFLEPNFFKKGKEQHHDVVSFKVKRVEEAFVIK